MFRFLAVDGVHRRVTALRSEDAWPVVLPGLAAALKKQSTIQPDGTHSGHHGEHSSHDEHASRASRPRNGTTCRADRAERRACWMGAMILRNARVLCLATGVAGDPVDLGVVDGVLVAPEVGEGEVVDLDGRVVMPGLWDQHVHMGQWAIHRQRWQVPPTDSAEECARLVADEVRRRGGSEPFVGIGHQEGRWDELPSAALLDHFVPDVPVVLVSADMHSVWVNSAGLAHHGVQHPSGRLVEAEAFDMEVRISQLPSEVVDEWVVDASREAAALGLVGITDMEWDRSDRDWQRRMEMGFDLLRVRACVWPTRLDEAIADDFRTGRTLAPVLECGPLKVIVDGSLGSRTAWLSEPYLNPVEAHPRGVLSVQPDELAELLSRASRAGIECALHAIGDAAVHLVLDGFERTGATGRVEHLCLVSPDDIARMARLGVAASMQPHHLALAPDAHRANLGPARESRVQPLRELADAGVGIVLGSDAPVVPLSPWQAVADAVAPPHAAQRLTLCEALLASTNGVSGLQPGSPADVCVLEANPFGCSVDELAALRSSLTLVAGRVTHSTL